MIVALAPYSEILLLKFRFRWYHRSIVLKMIFCLLYFVLPVICVSQNDMFNNSESYPTERFWIPQIFSRARDEFDMHPNVTEKCRTDYTLYKTHVRNQTMWALRMYEATAWISNEILAGAHFSLGHWDQCMLVSTKKLRSQYCIIKATYNFTFDNSTSLYTSSVPYRGNDEASVWDTLEMYKKNPIRARRDLFYWAMCIPSSCDIEDLGLSLKTYLHPKLEANNITMNIYLNPLLCHIQGKEPVLPISYYLVIAGLVGFVIIIIIVTFLHGRSSLKKINTDTTSQNHDTLCQQFIRDLSLITSGAKLKNTRKNKNSAVIEINFLKFVVMAFIVGGHRIMYITHTPAHTAEPTELVIYPSSYMLAILSVADIFFCISGFLHMYHSYKLVKKLGSSSIIILYISRWLRMVPVLLLIQLFIIYVYPYISNGPLWNYSNREDTENCKASFWANFFAVSNIVNADKQCLYVSWYTNVDIQLSIIGSVLIVLIVKNKFFGFLSTVLVGLLGVIITYLVVYYKHYNGMLLLYIEFLVSPGSTEEFNYFYTATYARILPYLIGLVSGYVTLTFRKKKIKFSAIQKLLLVTSSLILKIFVIKYGLQFYQLNRPYDVIENSLYAALSRGLFVLFTAVLLVVSITSRLTPLTQLSNLGLFAPLSRISYSVFLLNTVLQKLHSASQTTNVDSGEFLNHVWLIAGDIILTYCLGCLLYLFFEVPIFNVGKRLITISMVSNKKSYPTNCNEKVVPGSGV